jgi:indole-3-glycerol phosphate synthase
MDDILKKIINRTALDLLDRKRERPLAALRELPYYSRKTISFTNSLQKGSGIIAEHKRQSPSKGNFNCATSISDVVSGYEKAGASAISCLTDFPFFGGNLDDLLETRAAVTIPVLRKDFMIDPYQVHEAKAYGADVILLIAACLNDKELLALSIEALNLNLEILFEVHDLDELERVKKITAPFRLSKYAIGVNNRDLKRFKTDISNSVNLLPFAPTGVIAISESGINDPETVKRLRNAGYTGFLIGEHFMTTNDPGAACASFIKAIKL